jgi:hypothetical protein
MFFNTGLALVFFPLKNVPYLGDIIIAALSTQLPSYGIGLTAHQQMNT